MFSKKGKLSALMMNNKFIAVLSVIISLVLWMWIAIDKSPIETTVIKDVPVTIDLENSVPSQLGLEIFGNKDFKVDVTVSGKKFVVQTLDAGKITVSAQTNYVDGAGKKTLLLKATANADCDVVGLSSDYIDVYFDTLSKKEFTVEPVVNTELESLVPDDLMAGTFVLSQNSVTVSGPSSEVNSISGVQAVIDVNEALTSTSTFNPDIVFKGAKNTDYLSMDIDEKDITLTVPVLKVLTLDTTVTFKNTPAAFINSPLDFTVSPSQLKVALPVETADDVKNVSVATIDFSSISSGHNTYNFTTTDITDYSVLSDVQQVRVVVDAYGYTSSSYSVPTANISLKNVPDKFTVKTDGKQIENVKIIGTEEELQKLTNSDLFAEIDLSGVNLKEGSNTVEATITVKGSDSCWGYGKYEVTVDATAK
ncbi:MAG: hypothetical protein E7515_00280 [Ruminococcaceae bacterium]|jgi:hypothetical protein|nr:hypothetical protein [Oscillospiraceae bacterium]